MKERVDEVLSKLPAATKEAIAGLRDGKISEMNDLQLKEIMLIPDRYWDMAIWPIIDDQKQLKGLIFLVVDVTDRLKLYRQRQLLFNTFTHDLKNPIIGNQYLIKALLTDSRYNLEDSIKSVIDELDAGNQDVLRMIMNILEIAKLQNDEAMPAQRFESFDLRELLAQCANETARLGKSKNIQVTRQFPDQEQNIYSDKVALKHLVLNLLENAIKFSDENAQVAITISKDKPEAISFSVYNEGESLSEQEKQNLFKTIGQGELGRRYPGGSGIGLYLCSQLIQALGGDLQCTAGGEGTTFTATIPIVPAPPEARNDSAKEGSDRQSPSLEIVDHGAGDRLSKDEANQTPDNGGVAGEAQVEATGEDCHGRHEESGRPGSLSKTRTKQKRRKAQ